MLNNIKKINKSDFLFYFAATLIILTGIYARTKLYLNQTPLILDETLLGTNFFKYNFWGFFRSFANCGIKIPPFYSIYVKSVLEIFGYNILSFRFFPYISGIFSLFAVFILFKQYLKSKLAILFGLFIIAINLKTITYSSMLRPYTWDMLFTLLILISYKYISFKNISDKKILLYSLISVLLTLTSFPMFIIIPAVIIAKNCEEKNFDLKTLWIFFSIGCVCLYLYLIDMNLYKFMNNFWSDNFHYGFLELSLSSLNTIWTNAFNFHFLINPNEHLKWFLAAGLISLFYERKPERFLFLFVILFALIASFFHIYPFSQRHTIYLQPVFIFLIAKTIDFSLFPARSDNIYVKLLSLIKSILLFIILLTVMQTPQILKVFTAGDVYKKGIIPVFDNAFLSQKFSKTFLKKYKNNEPVYTMIYTQKVTEFYDYFYNTKKFPNYIIFYSKEHLFMLLEEAKIPFWIIEKDDVSFEKFIDEDLLKNELDKRMYEYELTYKDTFLYVYVTGKRKK